MAIQLNERDHLIFKLISEHRVLLEKHIAWFIAGEEKPVLIRDRLRKLFYLDYLLCQRHDSTLPWWTTPTKPLVYMLAPMSKSISADASESTDLFDSAAQRHCLEVANIRMVCLVAKRAGEIDDLSWITCKGQSAGTKVLDATVQLKSNGQVRKIGILNHPSQEQVEQTNLEACLRRDDIDVIGIVSRNENHQEMLRKQISEYGKGFDFNKVLLVTHHSLYKSGITKACWNSAKDQRMKLIDGVVNGSNEPLLLKQPIPQAQAASA